MKKNGYTDLPLHYGKVPYWLAERMSKLGFLIIEAIIEEFGKNEVLRRLSDPLWFQSLGCVLGMDWHSSGITTSVLGALKKSINPHSKKLGIYICGGRGKYSRQTPDELIRLSDKLGLNGKDLVRSSKLSAKIDNTAIQDGFQLYLHNFILTDNGNWIVIQQGMNKNTKMARRYHWHSNKIKSFDENPHTGIVGENLGLILNLTHKNANKTKSSLVKISHEMPDKNMCEIKKILMPRRHNVTKSDINLKRLGSVLATAYEKNVQNFCSLLLTNGLGPRTIQSLVLVSEIIYGTPSRFSDPARFSFAHGGKDGHPFPVPLKIYDESIHILKRALDKSKIAYSEKIKCLKRLHKIVLEVEKKCSPTADFDKIIEKENIDSHKYNGKTVFT